MKILLADDHTLFRDALVQYIKRADPDMEVATAKDFSEVMAILKEVPDQNLVLLDLRMPGMEGMQGFKSIREKFPAIRVALMSGTAEMKDVQVAMDLGAVGYFPKTLSGKSLIKAIQLVLSGEKFMPLDYDSNKVMPSYYEDEKSFSSSASGTFNTSKLTPRELEVLAFLARGASNKEIANQLGLQVVTVKLHVKGICRKLNAKNRTQAALTAKESGLIG